jgi:molybdate transport system substrate-binding protein
LIIMKLLSTLAVMGAMKDLIEAWRAAGGVEIEAEFAPTVALLETIRSGSAGGGVAILTAQGIEDLTAEGKMVAGSKADVALSFVGIAVKEGTPHPDISTVDTFTAALLKARCVAYSRIGASGIYFAGLLDRLGLRSKVNTMVVPSGFTAETLVTGEADIAVQQISELKVVSGIEVVGPLPDEIQTAAMFSAGILEGTADVQAAGAFLEFLSSPLAAPLLIASGLKPAGSA